MVSGRTHTDIYVQDVTTATRGLPGLLMGLAGSSSTDIHLHGPPNTAHALATARFFAKRVGRQLLLHEGEVGSSSRTVWPSHKGGGGFVIRALPSAMEGWHPTDEITPPVGEPSSDLGRKRRRSSDALPQETNGGPTSSVEYDALNYSRNRDQANSNGQRASSQVAVETAQDMFRAPQSREAQKSLLDDPSAVPKGRAPSAAWNQAKLPCPQVRSYRKDSEALSSQPLAFSYAVTLPTMAGKLDPEQAMLLGVSPGPALGQLHNGQSVTISRPAAWNQWSDAQKKAWSSRKPKGKVKAKKAQQATKEEVDPVDAGPMEQVTIESSQCVAPPVPGPVVLLLHLPSCDHISSFVSTSNASIMDEARSHGGEISLMVHSSSLDVLRDPRYQQWVAANSTPNTHHIMASAGLGRDLMLYPSAALLFLRLSKLDGEVFTFPPYSLTENGDLLDSLRPKGIDRSSITVLDQDLTVELQPRFIGPRPTSHNKSALVDDVTFDVNAPPGSDDHRKMLAKMTFEADEDIASATNGVEDKETQSRKELRRRDLRAAWLAYCDEAEKIRNEVILAQSQGLAATKKSWEGVRVTTLGTGSAGPSKYRNVAATLVKLPGRFFAGGGDDQEGPSYVLLDAGEGTLGQLAQRYGPGKPLDDILRRIRVVFISHIHADHCAGIAHLLRARALLQPDKPVYLVANWFCRRFLEEWSDLEDIGHKDTLVVLESEHLDHKYGVSVVGRGQEEQRSAYLAHLEQGFVPGFEHWASRVRKEVLSQQPFVGLDEDDLIAEAADIDARVRELMEHRNPSLRGGKPPDFAKSARNLYENSKRVDREMTRDNLARMQADLGKGFVVTTAEVDHRARHCYGIVVRIDNQDESDASFSFAFSGDTRPTTNLENAARGVDLYIHEATMQEDEAHEAYQRGHSTINGAIQSGRNAGADVVLLTHFSQRYPKMPRFNLHPDAVANGEQSRGDGVRSTVVAVGMDLLDISMNDMWKMERYLPAIDVLFKAEAAGVDEGETAEEEAQAVDS